MLGGDRGRLIVPPGDPRRILVALLAVEMCRLRFGNAQDGPKLMDWTRMTLYEDRSILGQNNDFGRVLEWH